MIVHSAYRVHWQCQISDAAITFFKLQIGAEYSNKPVYIPCCHNKFGAIILFALFNVIIISTVSCGHKVLIQKQNKN